MRNAAAFIVMVGLTGCTPSQDARAHRDADAAREDAKKALAKAKVEAQKAGREIDGELHKARDEARKALNAPKEDSRR